jgi:hypothetical protein
MSITVEPGRRVCTTYSEMAGLPGFMGNIGYTSKPHLYLEDEGQAGVWFPNETLATIAWQDEPGNRGMDPYREGAYEMKTTQVRGFTFYRIQLVDDPMGARQGRNE